MLTPYDEFPVHQSPYTFSYIPSTDYSWDDGYYFGFFNSKEKIFVLCQARVNPNSDMIGGYGMINVAGIQRTVRFSRSWRRDFSLAVGPFRIEFLEPLRRIRLTLEPNESGLDFDVVWEGVSPAYLEEHHIAVHRGRRTTDQTRYSQPGQVSGVLRLDGREWQVEPTAWSGARDHSWGLYAERPPLGPDKSLLPPRQAQGPRRSMRLWTVFRADPFSGVFHLHESEEGVQRKMDDVFGTPFGGKIYRGWSGDAIELKAGTHELEFEPGTRILKRGRVTLHDQSDGRWLVEYAVPTPPWMPATIGYTPGSWKDGGTFHTYHGSEELALEWDQFDFSRQPVIHKPYNVPADVHDSFGAFDFTKPVSGTEYLCAVTITAPDGSTATGACHLELIITGRYTPYGFTSD